MIELPEIEELHIRGTKGYTTPCVSRKLGGISRQAVHDYAKRHEWRTLGRIGRQVIWSATDVDRTVNSRPDPFWGQKNQAAPDKQPIQMSDPVPA